MRGYCFSLVFLLLQPVLLCGAAHPAQLLMGHVQVLQELKERFAAKKKLPVRKHKNKTGKMTQTEAYLSLYQNDVNLKWSHELKKYKTIIDTAMTREKEFLDTHYVLYHGQRNELCLLQDFLKKLFQLMEIRASAKDFEMMRAWFDALEKVETNDYLNTKGSWSYNGKEIFCANLSLFGNMNNYTSCTFHYFISDFNLSPYDPQNFIKEIFNHFGFDLKYIDKLLQLIKNVRTSEGRLFQVFIPKRKIDQFVYLSSTGATPWPNPIVIKEFDYNLNRHRSIAPILELYQTNPRAIQDMDQLQARVICSKDLMLNPRSGIKVFEYTTIPHNTFENYHTNLTQITENIVATWIAKNGNSGVFQSSLVKTDVALGKLFNYMHKDGHTFYNDTKPKGFLAPVQSLVKSVQKKIFTR